MIEDTSFNGGAGVHAPQPQTLRRCAICSKEYDETHVTIIDRQDELSLVHINCPHCKNSVLAWLAPTHIGMGMIGMLTDLSRDDVVRVRGREPFSEDELLSFYDIIHHRTHSFTSSLI